MPLPPFDQTKCPSNFPHVQPATPHFCPEEPEVLQPRLEVLPLILGCWWGKLLVIFMEVLFSVWWLPCQIKVWQIVQPYYVGC